MDPLLSWLSDSGRSDFMFTSTRWSTRPRAFWGAYAISKAALDMMANVYAQETEKTNIRVNIINPGTNADGYARISNAW